MLVNPASVATCQSELACVAIPLVKANAELVKVGLVTKLVAPLVGNVTEGVATTIGSGAIVRLTVAVAVPAVAPVPVIVKLVDANATVGVPEITPVVVLRDKPAGNPGDTLYVTVPTNPVEVSAVVGVIALFCWPLTVWVNGDNSPTAGVTVKFTVAVALPAVAPVPVTVKLVDANVTVGVPEITPVAVLRDKPAGKPGDTLYVTVPTGPDAVSTDVGVIARPCIADVVWVEGVIVESNTFRVTVAVAVPAVAPVPVTVKLVDPRVTVGVPDITPVEVFRDKPAGKPGDTE
jgi:hypothetical protein